MWSVCLSLFVISLTLPDFSHLFFAFRELVDLMHCERFLFSGGSGQVRSPAGISFVAVQSSIAFQLDECSIWAGFW